MASKMGTNRDILGASQISNPVYKLAKQDLSLLSLTDSSISGYGRFQAQPLIAIK